MRIRGKTPPTPRPSRAVDFETALGQINEAYFFREFTFSTNTFSPGPSAEMELADNIVWLDDFLIVSQVKERNAPASTTEAIERKWFSEKILKKATSQMRDTLSYLAKYPHIELRNNRGDLFNIASADVTTLFKLVVYDAHPLLPTECAFTKCYRSKTAGVIHLIHSADYLGILAALITPVEIAEYLAFREALLNTWGDALSAVSEKALVGQYIRNLPKERPSDEFEKYVDEVQQGKKDWDISKIIHLFADRQNTPQSPQEVRYKVIKELAKLYRTEMAEFKKRFGFSMKEALADTFCGPHRFTTGKGCGFVFIPLKREHLPNRQNVLFNFTALNKYDQRLDKCIGLTIIGEGTGDWCDVQWCPLEFPWKENPALQAALDKSNPFRPVKASIVERYGLSDLRNP